VCSGLQRRASCQTRKRRWNSLNYAVGMPAFDDNKKPAAQDAAGLYRFSQIRSVVAEGGLQQGKLSLDAVLVVMNDHGFGWAVDLAVEQSNAVLQTQ